MVFREFTLSVQVQADLLLSRFDCSVPTVHCWLFTVVVVVVAISMQYLKCALISVSFSSMLH